MLIKKKVLLFKPKGSHVKITILMFSVVWIVHLWILQISYYRNTIPTHYVAYKSRNYSHTHGTYFDQNNMLKTLLEKHFMSDDKMCPLFTEIFENVGNSSTQR